MWWHEYIGLLLEAVFAGFFGLFVISSAREREWRAFTISLLMGVITCGGWGIILLQVFLLKWVVVLALVALLLTGAYFVLLRNRGRRRTAAMGTQQIERVDERDTMFARANYAPGSMQYEEYYSRHTERRQIDDEIRSMPDLCSPDTPSYHPVYSALPEAFFDMINDMHPLVEGQPRAEKANLSPENASGTIKRTARYLGATDCRITRLEPHHIYTHRGRWPEDYGTEVGVNHQYAVVFTVEMDHRMVSYAPQLPTMIETARQYYESARLAVLIARHIRYLGYDARAHIDANYLVICPAIGVDAGLGEVGRIGLLMTESLGPRVRLATVTTDMPMKYDEPTDFGAVEFCKICKKCAENCPSGAIPTGEMKETRGIRKWTTAWEKCYKYWRTAGTDCAICIRVCPYSKPDTLIHRLVRFACRQTPLARKLAKLGDDLFYGRKPRRKRPPRWLT